MRYNKSFNKRKIKKSSTKLRKIWGGNANIQNFLSLNIGLRNYNINYRDYKENQHYKFDTIFSYLLLFLKNNKKELSKKQFRIDILFVRTTDPDQKNGVARNIFPDKSKLESAFRDLVTDPITEFEREEMIDDIISRITSFLRENDEFNRDYLIYKIKVNELDLDGAKYMSDSHTIFIDDEPKVFLLIDRYLNHTVQTINLETLKTNEQSQYIDRNLHTSQLKRSVAQNKVAPLEDSLDEVARPEVARVQTKVNLKKSLTNRLREYTQSVYQGIRNRITRKNNKVHISPSNSYLTNRSRR